MGVLWFVALLLLSAGKAPGSLLPPGFVEESVVEGLQGPITFTFGTRGELWIGERQGRILLWDRGRASVAARLATSFAGERGVLGIAVDPLHESNGYVYVYYTTQDPPIRNRLSRFRRVGDLLTEETAILETPDLTSNLHNAGCLEFAADGTLFLSTGDDRQGSMTAQNPFDLRGKILHIKKDGSPAPGNPFLDGLRGDPRVWAIGFRNPWRFTLQPESGSLFIGDVGASKWEELNIGIRGGNFGWNLTEGPEPAGLIGIVYPVYAYPHASKDGRAIIGGEHAPSGNFPPEYEGDYFFADNVSGELFRMKLDSAGLPASTEVFATDLENGPVAIRFGPDGALYYLTIDGGDVRRISYVGGTNRPPVARATLHPDSGKAPLSVVLDASGSADLDGDPLSFEWNLGERGVVNGERISTTFAEGVYALSLSVTDGRGSRSELRNLRVVSGNQRPSVRIDAPSADTRYRRGDRIRFRGSGMDPEGGVLPCSRLSWYVAFHHLGHTHPYLGPIQGACEGELTVDSQGEEQTYFEIRLTATDDGASLGAAGTLSATASVEIMPAPP